MNSDFSLYNKKTFMGHGLCAYIVIDNRSILLKQRSIFIEGGEEFAKCIFHR